MGNCNCLWNYRVLVATIKSKKQIYFKLGAVSLSDMCPIRLLLDTAGCFYDMKLIVSGFDLIFRHVLCILAFVVYPLN
jgi:hypothetical protein